jgi:LSU ribosomal protein L17P
MRHRVKKKHFDRTKEQRLALYRSLARALILEERIETSLQRAKAVRPFVEKLITLAKKGDLSARRRALQLLPDRKVIKKLLRRSVPGLREGTVDTRALSNFPLEELEIPASLPS